MQPFSRVSAIPSQADLLAVLHEASLLLARPDNNFDWSSWEDASSALAELDGLIACIEAGALPQRAAVEILFLPTGPMQEVSLSSGWGDQFVALADRFDAAVAKVYGVA